MTTLLDSPPNATPTPTAAAPGGSASPDRILGLRCRGCGTLRPIGVAYVCDRCFGPLEVAYDLPAIRPTVSRDTIAARSAGIWRYLELLPLDERPARLLAVGSTPLVSADRLGPALGVERLWLKDDTRNPTLSFKDRAVAIATATALRFGLPVLACASTGNLAGATAAAAAAAGLRSLVVIPADLEPAKIEHALAYGASVLPVEGTYDDVNRLCLEIADETGWGFVNVNLRPFYAEGSKTLAFEVAEQLGWRTPDVIVSPIASGALFTKLAEGFEQLAAIGLIERRPVRYVGAQAAGCGPVATAWASGSDVVRPVREPDTFVRSLAIGSPADGAYAAALATSS
ncbi:MAG TPA: threonine synthase, partial [Candidatus Limnocylindrales bacterium]|nr:threonine synthase [Candidatus Limnocylindrales bacterium]